MKRTRATADLQAGRAVIVEEVLIEGEIDPAQTKSWYLSEQTETDGVPHDATSLHWGMFFPEQDRLVTKEIHEEFPFPLLQAELKRYAAKEALSLSFLYTVDPTLALNLRQALIQELELDLVADTELTDFLIELLTKADEKGLCSITLKKEARVNDLPNEGEFGRIKQALLEKYSASFFAE